MKQLSALLTIVLLSLLKVSNAQQSPKDSCEIYISNWFDPICNLDTCAYTKWIISYTKQCNIDKVLCKVYDPKKNRLIYKSDKTWEARTGSAFPNEYYAAGYYPYEIIFITKDKKIIKKHGKVQLHIDRYIENEK